MAMLINSAPKLRLKQAGMLGHRVLYCSASTGSTVLLHEAAGGLSASADFGRELHHAKAAGGVISMILSASHTPCCSVYALLTE